MYLEFSRSTRPMAKSCPSVIWKTSCEKSSWREATCSSEPSSSSNATNRQTEVKCQYKKNTSVKLLLLKLLSLVSSKASKCHVIWWRLDVPWLSWGICIQPTTKRCLPGHEPATVPLLHLFFSQHLPNGGPASRTQQCRRIHQVVLLTLKLQGL